MNKFLKSILVAALALIAITAAGAEVNLTAAQASASRFVKSHARAGAFMAPGAEMRLAHIEKSVAHADAADYYVFNASDGSAFVIVAGDDRAEEILGFGEGSMDMDNLPCNLQWLLRTYQEQMEYLHAHPTATVQRAAPYNDVTIAPMVTCNWNQRAPYNNQCPEYEGERSVTGCVATAMAQVMYYWRFPSKTPAVGAYTTRTHKIYLHSLPSKPLDWDSMLDIYSGDYTEQQADAVALLMRYCGQSSQMDYSPTGSGTYVHNQLQGMRAFGYSYDASMLDFADYSVNDWDALMQQDLLDGRPILYSGADPLAGGHAFVLDGYYDGKYHINWGWGGTGDGYFMLGAFSVRGYAFTAQQQMLHNVHPPTSTEPVNTYDFVADGIYYKYNDASTGVLVASKNTNHATYSGSVVIPATVTLGGASLPVVGIGEGAFMDCIDLTSVTLPASVREIGRYAFRNCINLQEAVVPLSVTAIGPQAFANCYKLASVQLPASLTTIGARAFVDCLALKRVDIPSLAAWLGISFADELSNPLSQAHHLYVDGTEVTELEIPATLTESISRYAFAGFSALTGLTLDGVKYIGTAAFKDCSGITQLTLPESVQEIGSEAFSGCTALTAITVPASVQQLGSSAFASCTGLQSAEVLASVTEIPSRVFSGCTSLKTVQLSPSLKTIGASAFDGCSKLDQLNLPASLTGIGSSAFSDCTGLKAVTLPASVASIGDQAFSGCTALVSLVLPDSLSVIADQTFADCQALKSVVIPDKVVSIGNKAFFRCVYLTSVTLGSGLQEIGPNAFANDPRIKTITSMAPVPPQMSSPDCVERSIYKNATLKVPVRYVQTYKHTGVWSWFVNVEGIVGITDVDVNGDGEITVADVNAIIQAILSRDSSCDVNCDGEVTVADVNTVINFILKR